MIKVKFARRHTLTGFLNFLFLSKFFLVLSGLLDNQTELRRVGSVFFMVFTLPSLSENLKPETIFVDFQSGLFLNYILYPKFSNFFKKDIDSILS